MSKPLMRAARVGTLLFAFLMAGCGTKPAPPTEPPQPAAPQPPAGTAAPAAPPVAPSSPPSPQAPAVSQAPLAAAEPAERPSAPPAPAPAIQAPAKAGAPVAKAPAKTAAPPVSAVPPAKKEQAAGAQEAAPPLDLTSLETRLKETKAIGVMTKLALKNQVDDLLNQFRAFYAGKLKTTLAELRRPFDLLILKVLSLLQDSDPSLASAIVASREAIWGILSDPVKFANFAST